MKRLVIVMILMIILCSGCSGCEPLSSKDYSTKFDESEAIHKIPLPSNATHIIDRGNGWIEFSLDDNRFLFICYGYSGHGAWSAITQIK